MSVTISGIKGYEYQYKATVLISLLNNIKKEELFVESKGMEDAYLLFRLKNAKRKVEIQVKREKNELNIKKLVKWLCHFDSRSASVNLIDRIINDDVIALFITQSRCSDDILILKNDVFDLRLHDKIKVKDKWLDEFTEHLGKKNRAKGIDKKRNDYCISQVKLFPTKNKLNPLLKNIIIWEELPDDKIDYEIARILNTEYKISQSSVFTVYKELLDVVLNGRDNKTDILPEINKTLARRRIGSPIIDEDYHTRDEEKELQSVISSKGVLLLTGISLCGKSELAKTIAFSYFEKGFDYKISDDISEIKRFFGANSTDSKVAILEDPFGHIDLVENSFDISKRLEGILSNLHSHHKLIITTRREILTRMYSTKHIEECKIGSHIWNDLTINDPVVLNDFWAFIAKKNNLPKRLTDIVSKNIAYTKESELIQIGQLRFLASEELSTLNNKKYIELEHIARSNSKEIAELIRNKSDFIAEIMSIISLCCNTINPVNYRELAYILSPSEELASFTEKTSFTSTFDEQIPVFPNYESNTEFNKETNNALEYLEERLIIKVIDDEIFFTHPNYLEAGRSLLNSNSQTKQRRILNYFKKALFCLNPVNANHAIQNFYFFKSQFTPALRCDLINIAFECNNSIFPSIEDNSLVFLINQLDDLNKDQAKKLIQLVQRGGTKSSDIYWHNNSVPFIANTSGFTNMYIDVDKHIVKEVEKKLRINKLPSTYQAWIYIEHLKKDQNNNLEEIRKLLLYNEAFIRSKVAFLLIEALRVEHKMLIDEIFNDEHPTVIFNAIQASILNWTKYSTLLKTMLKTKIRNVLYKRQIAIRASNFIASFSIEGEEGFSMFSKDLTLTEKEELWELWGELYIITVDNLPLNIYFNSSRFGSTMDEAIKSLSIETGVLVLESWFKRIDYQIKNNIFLDEFEFAVADNLLQLTENNYAIREKLFVQLVNYEDTNFLLSSLKWIINYWDNLHSSEKTKILELIGNQRTDTRWIKAVLLTSEVVPNEVQDAILGNIGLFQKTIDDFYNETPKQLLKDCLNCFCGFPQPLSWFAFHSKNRNFWHRVVEYVLLDENRIGFDICLEHFLSRGVNGFGGLWNNWEKLWFQICNNSINKERLILNLIKNTSSSSLSIDVTKKLWDVLIDSYLKCNRENDVISIIADNIEVLQQTGHKEDLLTIFDLNFFEKKLFPKLIPDFIILNILRLLNDLDFINDEEKIKMINQIAELFQDKNIRFFGTFKIIDTYREEGKIPKEVFNILDNQPKVIDNIGKERLNELEKPYRYKLNDWVGLN